MAVLPAASYVSDAARTQGEVKTALEDIRDKVAGIPGGAVQESLTISSGAITPGLSGAIVVDTQSAASTDDLDNIVLTNYAAGAQLRVRAADAAHTVVLKHESGGSGQLSLADGADLSLDDTKKSVLFLLVGTTWIEVQRFYGRADGGHFIGEVVASAQAAAELTSLITAEFDEYVVRFHGVVPATDDTDLLVEVSNDNGSTWKTTGYRGVRETITDLTSENQSSSGSTSITLTNGSTPSVGNASDSEKPRGRFSFFRGGSSLQFVCNWNLSHLNSGGTIYNQSSGSAQYGTSGAIDAIRFRMSSGNISGTFRLYGVRID